MSSKVITNPKKATLPGMNRNLPSGCGNYREILDTNDTELLLFASVTGNRAVRRKAIRKLNNLKIQGGHYESKA